MKNKSLENVNKAKVDRFSTVITSIAQNALASHVPSFGTSQEADQVRNIFGGLPPISKWNTALSMQPADLRAFQCCSGFDRSLESDSLLQAMAFRQTSIDFSPHLRQRQNVLTR